MEPQRTNGGTHIITDLDDTAKEWLMWFAPALLEVTPQLVAVLGCTEEALYHNLGWNMVQSGTHEDPFVFRGDFFRNLWGDRPHSEFVRLVSRPYYETMDRYRNAHPLNEACYDTLAWAAASGVSIHFLSDAPLFATLSKLKRFAVEGIISSILAIETVMPTEAEAWNLEDLAYCKGRVDKGMARAEVFSQHGTHVEALSSRDKKPSVRGCRRILTVHEITDLARVKFIGDSVHSDGGAAKRLGISFWQYQPNPAPAEYRRLIDYCLNPWRDEHHKFSWALAHRLLGQSHEDHDAHSDQVHEETVLVQHWGEVSGLVGAGASGN